MFNVSHTLLKFLYFFKTSLMRGLVIFSNASRTATIALESIYLSWGIPAYTFYVLIDYTLIV